MGGVFVIAMNELHTSNDVLGDWEALRARMRFDGYVFVRGLIDKPVVSAAAEQARQGLIKAGWMSADGRARRPVHQATVADAGYRAMAVAAAVNRLPYEPGPQRLMELLCGAGVFVYPVKVPRVVYPDRIAPRHRGRFVHQDYGVIGKQDLFTMWLPLQDIPIEMGPVAVLPGSSRLGWASPHRLSPIEPNWATTQFQPGDALIFHCLTWHAALANTTDRIRLSIDVRWQLDQDPAPAHLVYGPPTGRRGGQPKS
ncbi:MAG TPA: phytanoyl-CoA dioxygenase family protein, partial [Ilumatobacteraceae bacterium]